MSDPLDGLFGRGRQTDDEPSHLELERYFNGELTGTEEGQPVGREAGGAFLSARGRRERNSLNEARGRPQT